MFANQSKPIGFTSPHSAFIPVGAQTMGFGVFDGLFLLDRGAGAGPEGRWKACPVPESVVGGSWGIYWDGVREGAKGALGRECVDVKLKVREIKTC